MITNTTVNLIAQVAPAEPNWVMIVILVAVFLGLVIFLACPSKDQKAITSDDKKKLSGEKKEALSSEDVNLENYEEKKENLSLAEIKVAKRQTADEMSKEELRELRKERRAATQTEKAVKEHDEVSEESKAASENMVSDDKAASKDEEKVESKVEEKPVDLNDVITKTDAGTEELFSSLFGDDVSNDDSGISFGDDFGDDAFGASSVDEEDDDSIIPTLGSALIPLDQLLKAAEEDGKSEKDALEELSLTFPTSDPAEKKTLN